MLKTMISICKWMKLVKLIVWQRIFLRAVSSTAIKSSLSATSSNWNDIARPLNTATFFLHNSQQITTTYSHTQHVTRFVQLRSHLQLHESWRVALEVRVVDLAHRLDVLVANLARDLTLVVHQELVEKPATHTHIVTRNYALEYVIFLHKNALV